jgi:16S rRNA (guanine527-N7)-methyltransferase
MNREALWLKFIQYLKTAFDFEPDQGAIERFDKFLELLTDWNQKINLVSFKSAEEAVFRHFADSLACAHYLNFLKPARICDIGAGAGLPGIPVKIAFPDIELTLIESIGKKCLFMQETLNTLDLKGVKILLTLKDLEKATILFFRGR